MISDSSCSTRQKDFKGWRACYLENGYITLVAVPDIGGRVMAYNLGDYEYFFVDPDLAGKLFSPEENLGQGKLEDWKNYGGDKTWPAPQGWDNNAQWHGPPDPVLDTGKYLLEELSGDRNYARVRMVSPPDDRTGVQITRQLTIHAGSSRVELDLKFTNVKDEKIRWSIWDVAQLRAEHTSQDGTLSYDPGCIVTVPLNPNSKFPNGYYVMFGDESNPQWQVDEKQGLFVAPYHWEIGKVGIDSTAGWIAFCNTTEGYGFAETFNFYPEAEYPDDGVSVECWTVGAGVVDTLNYEETQIYLMETEVLGPIQTIQPNSSTEFSITWGACRCPGKIIDVTPAGCVSNFFVSRKAGNDVQISFEGGVFERGLLQLVWRDGNDLVLETEEILPVNPLEAIKLNHTITQPAEAVVVELRVVPDTSGDSLQLAQKTLV